MRKLIIANWKMNPGGIKEAVKLAGASDFKGAVIAPPYVFIPAVKAVLKKAALGAQDAFWEESGAYTGEISPGTLKKMGVGYVVIGHSERRRRLSETDEMINKKLLASLKSGLKVILCVGEDKSIRKKGFSAAKNFVRNQLKKNLRGVKSSVISHRSLVIAYEPIWAIGTGRPARPRDAVLMHAFIKKFLASKPYVLRPRIVYGGSVNSGNIGSFLANPEVEGALVGGASLNASEFRKILKIAAGY